MRICICGGGNLGHVVSGYLAGRKGYEVNLLTRHPERYVAGDEPFIVNTPEGCRIEAFFHLVTSDPAAALDGADMVLLCLPGFAIAEELEKIAPFVTPDKNVGSIFCSSGFFPMAFSILPKGTKLFGLQRVPFVARTVRYGHEANLMGYRDELFIATENIDNAGREALRSLICEMLDEPASLLDTYLEVTLTNSNPLLHPSRLYGMFSSREEYDRPLYFYEDWDNASSEVLIACDAEFQRLRAKLGIPQEAIPTSLDHYESHDAASMTAKISSISSLKGILAPMIEENGKYRPDYANRYFTEDIPYGLVLIKAYSLRNGIDTPTIDKVILWAQERMGKEYLTGGELKGRDLGETVARFFR